MLFLQHIGAGLLHTLGSTVICSDERILSVTEQTPQSGPAENPQPEDDQPTPQITQSQAKRLMTPMVSMIITMGVLAGILAAVWFMNPEPDVTYTRDEDVAEAAEWADGVAEYSPIAPEVPEGWTANYARWETRAEFDVDVWEVGYTTDAVAFVGFAQSDNANPAWVNEETDQAPVEGTQEISGFTVEVRETNGRQFYVLDAEDNDVDGTTVIIGGDAGEEEFGQAAEAILESVGRDIDHAEEGEETDD